MPNCILLCAFLFWFSDFHSTFYYLIHIPKFALLSNQQTNPSNCQLILFQHEIDLMKSPTMRNIRKKLDKLGKKCIFFCKHHGFAVFWMRCYRFFSFHFKNGLIWMIKIFWKEWIPKFLLERTEAQWDKMHLSSDGTVDALHVFNRIITSRIKKQIILIFKNNFTGTIKTSVTMESHQRVSSHQ